MHAILVHEGCFMNYIVFIWDKIKMKWLSFFNLLQTISSYSSDRAIFLNKILCITCALIIWLMSSADSHFFSCFILFTKKIYKSNKFIALFNTLWQLISFVLKSITILKVLSKILDISKLFINRTLVKLCLKILDKSKKFIAVHKSYTGKTLPHQSK